MSQSPGSHLPAAEHLPFGAVPAQRTAEGPRVHLDATPARNSWDPEADWTALAACRDSDPDELFVQGAAQNRAKTRCFGCLVRTECLADALDNRVEFGVWGGMTERERRALLRRRQDVTSWKRLLLAARAEALSERPA